MALRRPNGLWTIAGDLVGDLGGARLITAQNVIAQNELIQVVIITTITL